MRQVRQLNLLRRPLVVKYRARDSPKQVDAKIRISVPGPESEYKQTVLEVVSCVQEFEDITIELGDIKRVVPRDYTQGTLYVWVLFVEWKEEKGSSGKEAFQFNRKEDRDTWEDGLSSLVGNTDVSMLNPMDAGGSLMKPIELVKIVEPPKDAILSLQITLGDQGSNGKDKHEETRQGGTGSGSPAASFVCLNVQKDCTSEQDTQKLVKDFVLEHKIHSSEKLSLFRFVRTLVERINAEAETEKLVKEIEDLNYESVMKGLSIADRDKLDENWLYEANIKLDGIRRSIEDRIGKRGTNSALIKLILERSTDKVKQVNELGIRALNREREKAKAREGFRDFCQCADE